MSKLPAPCGVSRARCRAGLCRVRRSRRIGDWPLPSPRRTAHWQD